MRCCASSMDMSSGVFLSFDLFFCSPWDRGSVCMHATLAWRVLLVDGL